MSRKKKLSIREKKRRDAQREKQWIKDHPVEHMRMKKFHDLLRHDLPRQRESLIVCEF